LIAEIFRILILKQQLYQTRHSGYQFLNFFAPPRLSAYYFTISTISLRHLDAFFRVGIINTKRMSFIRILLYEELNL